MFFLILGAVSAADTNATIQSSIDDAQDALNDEVDNNLESASADDLEAGEDSNNSVSASADDLEADDDTNVLKSEDTNELSSGEDVNILSASEKDVVADKKATVKVTSPSTIVKLNAFSVRVTDANGKGIAGKTVKFSLNGNHFSRTTDASGYANLKLNLKSKYYTIYYMFNEKGYTTVKGNSKILVVTDNQSKITARTYVAYKGFDNPYAVTLSVDGIKLAKKNIKFELDGKTYSRQTDSNGKAVLKIYSNPGKHIIRYSFAGGNGIKKTNGCKTLIVKKGMPITITSLTSSLTFRQNALSQFKVKVMDARGNPVKAKIVFRMLAKNYVKTIDKNGYATFNIKLKKAGTYNLACYHKKDSKYNYKSLFKTVRIIEISKDNGFWLFGSDMNHVNLKTLADYGTKHIFLNYYAIQAHGRSGVENFIARAGNYGINVHIWMQIFYDGSWISPVNDDGSYKYSFFNSKIQEAKSYATLKGVAGIHMDYLRFPGTAYQHTNGVNAINYFTKELSDVIHAINPNLIVSAAVMPEVDSNKYYYGQDIPTLSRYLDAIVPMVYKGNYNSGTNWIKTTTAAFVKQSNGAEIWTGLQAYRSDDDVRVLSASELFNDAKAAMAGGAAGVISFRWGVSSFINFNDL
jgi:hypothetical protein